MSINIEQIQNWIAMHERNLVEYYKRLERDHYDLEKTMRNRAVIETLERVISKLKNHIESIE